MKIVITGINFNYNNGYEEGFTSVNLSFNSSGNTFNLGGFVEVTNEEYLNAAGNPEKYKILIKDKVITSVTEG